MFVAGKLRGFRRIRNDRLLMFCLRMNARDEHGRRLSASYFDAGADRLSGSGGSGPASFTVPALSRAEKDDMNAAIIGHFDPVRMTLPEIEAQKRLGQAMLSQAAARRRAEEEGPLEANLGPAFIELRSSDWKEAGELESLVDIEDELDPFDPEEDHWRDLDEEFTR